MPQLAAVLSLHYQHDEPTSFFIIPIEAAHRQLSRRPPQLAGGVAATELDHGIRKKQAGEEEGGQEEGRVPLGRPQRKRRGPSAQHAKLPRSGE